MNRLNETGNTVSGNSENGSPLNIRPLANDFGGEVHGVDLSAPLPDTAFNAIRDAFHQRGVLLFRDQALSLDALVAFASRFGPLDIHHLAERTFPDHPEVRVLSNVRRDGKLIGTYRGGHYWHSDLSFLPETGYATFLYGIECPPEGADTLFADMRAAWDAMPSDMRSSLEGKTAMHDRAFRYSEIYPERPPLTPEQIAKVPPAEHPAIVTHPPSGRKSVFLMKDMIRGLGDLDEEATYALVSQVEAFCTRPQFVYPHKWREGDLVMWDNRATLHRATPYDAEKYTRLLHRVQIKGEAPV